MSECRDIVQLILSTYRASTATTDEEKEREAIAALTRQYGGARIYVEKRVRHRPLTPAFVTNIAPSPQPGLTVQTLRRTYGISRATAYRWVRSK